MFNMHNKRDHHFPEIARKLGFKFHSNVNVQHEIDWRYIGCLNIDEITQENDCERIEYGLTHISDASLGTLLRNSILDPAVSKYFILAQLSIQYLHFCRKFLEESIYGINKQLSDNEKEINKLQKSNRKKDSEILALHKKLECCIGGASSSSQSRSFPCTECTKNFISPEMLAAHMSRKHAVVVSSCVNTQQDTNMINMIKLELEIKQLKEKLNANDLRKTIHLKEVGVQKDDNICVDKEYVSIGIQTNLEEVKEKNDFEENMRIILQNQQNYLENFHRDEIQRYEGEMNTVKQQLTDTLHELKRLHDRDKTAGDQVGRTNELLEAKLYELQNLYSQNQNTIAESLCNLDAKYSRNFKNLEQIIEKKAIETPVQIVQAPKTVMDKAVITETHALHPIKTLNSIERSQAFDEQSVQSVSSARDESSENDEDDVKFIMLDTNQLVLKTQAQVNRTPSPNRDIAVKTILSKPVLKPQTNRHPKTALSILNAKLREFGIAPAQKTLTGSRFSHSMDKLAEKREVSKRNFSKFFIMRSNIQRDLDKAVNERFKLKIQPTEVEHMIKPVPQPRRFLSERTTSPVLDGGDQSKPVAAERRTSNVNMMYHEVEEEVSSDASSDLDKIEKSAKGNIVSTEVDEAGKPIPKKRVIFDLHKSDNNELKVDENVSDWEISSFSQ